MMNDHNSILNENLIEYSKRQRDAHLFIHRICLIPTVCLLGGLPFCKSSFTQTLAITSGYVCLLTSIGYLSKAYRNEKERVRAVELKDFLKSI
jgi:hypothetical protein